MVTNNVSNDGSYVLTTNIKYNYYTFIGLVFKTQRVLSSAKRIDVVYFRFKDYINIYLLNNISLLKTKY